MTDPDSPIGPQSVDLTKWDWSASTRVSMLEGLQADSLSREETWRKFVAGCGKALGKRLKSGLKQDETVAHDLLQDILLKVYCNIPEFLANYDPKKPGGFRGWLMTITLNTVRDSIRKQKPERLNDCQIEFLADRVSDEQFSIACASEFVDLFRNSFRVLGKEQLWSILVDRALHGMSAEDMLRKYAFESKASVDNAVWQARDLLRKAYPAIASGKIE